MMVMTIYLAWSLANCCPLVEHYRSQGLNDAQIEQLAREHRVPEWVIRHAKRHCRAA